MPIVASCSPSSNRTCGFPASGSPGVFLRQHARGSPAWSTGHRYAKPSRSSRTDKSHGPPGPTTQPPPKWQRVDSVPASRTVSASHLLAFPADRKHRSRCVVSSWIYKGLTRIVIECHRLSLIRRAGLEPATFGLEIRCSIRLSYRRNVLSIHNLFKVRRMATPEDR